MRLGPSSSAIRFAAAVTVAALLGGCGAPNKSVTVVTEPAGASIRLERLTPAGGGAAPELASGAASPAEVNLSFPHGDVYRATATKEQYLPASVDIALEPKGTKTYRIRLTRYLADCMEVDFVPRFVDRTWSLAPQARQTLAYLLSAAEASGEPTPTQVTDNHDPNVDFRSIATSPTGDDIVYQRVERHVLPARAYTVKGHETLEQIAAETGASAESIKAANPQVHDFDRLPGEVLKVERVEFVSEIYKQSRGGRPARLTTDQAIELTPAFDAIGEYVVFASDASGNNATLWTVKREGGGTRRTRLTRSDALDYEPSVGHDYVAYTSIPARSQGPGAGVPQVWTTRFDGTEPSKLTDGESAQISPDDRRIVYIARVGEPAADGHYTHRLRMMNVDGSDPRALIPSATYDIIDPKWSPDGKWVVFAANPRGDAGKIVNFDLFVVPADGSRPPRRLTRNEAYDSCPTFDRTGRSVYFRSNRGGNWNIWRMAVDAPVSAPRASR